MIIYDLRNLMLTGVMALPPASTAMIFRILSSSNPLCVSTVPPALWHVIITLPFLASSRSRGWTLGSSGWTSRAADDSRPLSRASATAASSTRLPRATLTNRPPSENQPRALAPIRGPPSPSPGGVAGVHRTTQSAAASRLWRESWRRAPPRGSSTEAGRRTTS